MSNEARVAVVTGASGGIGSAIVKKFYENGYSVAMCDINEEALKAVALQRKNRLSQPSRRSRKDLERSTL